MSKAEHGTRTEYQRGCRCEFCKEANNLYNRERNARLRPAVVEYMRAESFINEGDMRWVENAACRKEDTALFFPTRGETAKLNKAKAICASCPVQEDCLSYALRTEQEIGIWGGKSGRELRALQAVIQTERRKQAVA